ncbi:MAG: TRAP transporter permease DctQ [Ideonella sp. MAG2]|nr:MAG: TRAP transporter permease DctQ [Ideonella sp. MAG2]
MQRWANPLFHVAAQLAGLSLLCTLLMVLFSITGRLWPSVAITGADAYAGYFTAATAFLALAPTLKRGEHIRVTLIFNHLGPRAQHVLDVVCHALALLMAGALALYSVRLVLQSRSFMDISTGLDATPLWIPQLGMAVGCVLFALAFLTDLIRLLQGESLHNPSGELARTE